MKAESRFCAACGAPSGAPAPRGATGHSSTALQITTSGAVVFTVFLAIGAGMLYRVTATTTEPERAVPGRPTGPAAQAPAGAMPQSHPSIELPEEVVTFLDDLAKQAEAAPTDVDVWQRLTRARYRASTLNPTFAPSAAKALAHLFELDPNNLEGLRIAGNLAYDAGRYPEAQAHFEKYIGVDANDPGVLTDLGSSLLFQEKLDEAMERYRQAVDKDPKFVQGHFNLGIALQQKGDKPAALESFRKARELATAPEQIRRIDEVIAVAEGREPPAAPVAAEAAPQAGGATVASRPTRPAASAPAASRSGPATNASSEFQQAAEALVLGHTIVGPRIGSIHWSGASAAKVTLNSFPMDQMPPVMRNKFKSGMNEKLAALAAERGVALPLAIELVDESGRVMDTLDGKEWVGAFDEAQYQ